MSQFEIMVKRAIQCGSHDGPNGVNQENEMELFLFTITSKCFRCVIFMSLEVKGNNEQVCNSKESRIVWSQQLNTNENANIAQCNIKIYEQ